MDLGKIVKKLTKEPQGYENIKSEIRNSANNSSRARLSYRNRKGHTKTYDVEPYSYKRKGKGKTFLYAKDVSEGIIKMFNTKNIRSASASRKKFSPEYSVEVGSRIIDSFVDEIMKLFKKRDGKPIAGKMSDGGNSRLETRR